MMYDDDVDYYEFDDDYGDDYYEDDTMNKTSLYPLMEAAIQGAFGINFTLLMEHEIEGDQFARDYSIHPRYSQPCLGEMRKYYETHGDGCTQPNNGKPTDLWHPFPWGKPVSVGYSLHNISADNNRFIRDMFTKTTSPWAAGIGSPTFVTLPGSDVIVGMYMTNLKVDPTVLVNLMNVMKNFYIYGTAYQKMLDRGLSSFEAMALILLTGGDPLVSIDRPDGYYTTNRLSVRRILEPKPRDLSGGLYSDRFDYNRTELENVFMNDDKPAFGIKDRLVEKGLATPGYYGSSWKETVPEKDRIDTLLSLLHELRDSEQPPKETKFNLEKQKCEYVPDPIQIETQEIAA